MNGAITCVGELWPNQLAHCRRSIPLSSQRASNCTGYLDKFWQQLSGNMLCRFGSANKSKDLGLQIIIFVVFSIFLLAQAIVLWLSAITSYSKELKGSVK